MRKLNCPNVLYIVQNEHKILQFNFKRHFQCDLTDEYQERENNSMRSIIVHVTKTEEPITLWHQLSFPGQMEQLNCRLHISDIFSRTKCNYPNSDIFGRKDHCERKCVISPYKGKSLRNCENRLHVKKSLFLKDDRQGNNRCFIFYPKSQESQGKDSSYWYEIILRQYTFNFISIETRPY